MTNRTGKRMLAIGAHPDDIEVGCGGFLQKASAASLIVLSSGSFGGDGSVRIEEGKAGALVLNSSITIHDLADTAIETRDAIPIIEREIKRFKPDIILTMAKSDTHQDHRAVYEATKAAVKDTRCTVISYAGPSSAEFFQPTWFVPISELEIEKKLSAIACHVSQDKRSYLTKEYTIGMARYWAMITRSEFMYVEPYEIIKHWEIDE